MVSYYEGFIKGVTLKLELGKEAVTNLREVCEAYGVDWKLDK